MVIISFFVFVAVVAIAFWGKTARRNEKPYEAEVAERLASLDPKKFIVFNDVLLPDGEGGTTQIDHIVVCSGGLYCIETKGWGKKTRADRCDIYASAETAQWKIYYKSHGYFRRGTAFATNPLRQNHKHHLCLGKELDIPLETIHPMVVMPPNCILRTGPIPGVFNDATVLVREIASSAHGKVFETGKIKDILVRLNIYAKATDKDASLAHVGRLRAKFSSDICPRCGGRLVQRVSKRDGHPFLGCSNFPYCRYTRMEGGYSIPR